MTAGWKLLTVIATLWAVGFGAGSIGFFCSASRQASDGKYLTAPLTAATPNSLALEAPATLTSFHVARPMWDRRVSSRLELSDHGRVKPH